MAMHNVQFPPLVDFGFRSGQGWQTLVQTTASGHEIRTARWAQARLLMQANRALSPDSETAEVYEFLMARRGALYAFRAKDWNDYSTDPTHRTPGNITAEDQLCQNTATGTAYGDGTTTTFKLRKQYDIAGLNPYVRTNIVPIDGTVVAAIDGTPTTDFTVNESLRQITFDTAPGVGLLVTCGFEFDVPMRITEAMDRAVFISIEAFGLHARPIELIEALDEVETPETWDAGGSTDGYLALTAPITVDFHTKLWAVDPATANIPIFLPNPVNQPGGPDYFQFYVKSGAAGSISIYDDTGTLVGSLSGIAAGGACAVSLLHDQTNSTHTWIGVIL